MLARLPVSGSRSSRRLRLGWLRKGAVKVWWWSVCSSPVPNMFLHLGAPGIISSPVGSGQGGPTGPRLRVSGFEEVRASLGDLIEELVVLFFRELAAGLHLGAEQLP